MEEPLPCYLDLGDGSPPARCRDAQQALLLARVYIAIMTGRPAIDMRPRGNADDDVTGSAG